MIRPDNMQFYSALPSYTNPSTVEGSLPVIGNILPDGFSFTFTTTLTVDTAINKIDLYGINTNTGLRELLSSTGFPSIYQNSGGEAARHEISYAPGSITYSLTISNGTGGVLVLIDQTINLKAFCYTLPV